VASADSVPCVPTPAHALSAEERELLLRVANEPRFAELLPLVTSKPNASALAAIITVRADRDAASTRLQPRAMSCSMGVERRAVISGIFAALLGVKLASAYLGGAAMKEKESLSARPELRKKSV
jgi:hypothetical protein